VGGRRPLETVLTRLDEQVTLFHQHYGGLPRAVEADQILREIWIEDTYHSSRLEGNALPKREVRRLLVEGEVRGPLSDSLEIEGYGQAARWVYSAASDYPLKRGIPLGVVQAAHRLLVEPAWSLAPPSDGSRPGGFRRRGVSIAGSSVRTTPPIALDGAMQDWIERTGPEPRGVHGVQHVADMHAWVERIHPFADGNGRVGRLLMNFMLIQRGYPPAVLNSTSRQRYLRGLARADSGHCGGLTELIARAIESSLNQFLIPHLAGDARLVPLAALAESSEFRAPYLRNLAISGRLRAVREGSIWLSSKAWLDDYRGSRSPRGRRPRTPPAGSNKPLRTTR